MGNVLRMEKLQQIQALTRLGWTNCAISREIDVDRDTISKYRKQSENPQVPTDSGPVVGQNPPEAPADLPAAPPTNSSTIQPYNETLRLFYLQQLTAQRMYQDLVEQHGYKGSYDSIKRYVRKLKNYRQIIYFYSRERWQCV